MPWGSSPGERRDGRRRGTPNKATLEVAEKLRAIGCDPIEGMARIAMDPESSPELRLKAYTEIAHYVAPKRKAPEMTGDLDVEVRRSAISDQLMTAEEWVERYGAKTPEWILWLRRDKPEVPGEEFTADLLVLPDGTGGTAPDGNQLLVGGQRRVSARC
jgi:hypothetical protein